MSYDRIGVEKVQWDGEDKFIVKLVDSQLRNPFMYTSEPLTKDGAVKELRKVNVPEQDIQKMLADAGGGTG